MSTILIPGFEIEVPPGGNLFASSCASLRRACTAQADGRWGRILKHRRHGAKKPEGLITPDPAAAIGLPEEVLGRGSSQDTSGTRVAIDNAPDDFYHPSDGGNIATAIGWVEIFQYRSVQLLIPVDWYQEYLLDWMDLYSHDVAGDDSLGLVSSIWDTLDEVWSRFRIFASGDHDTFHSMLGCYNLPLDHSTRPENSPLFWKVGWGPPHAVYLYACQLVRTYANFAEASELRECEDLSGYMRIVLNGWATLDTTASTYCWVTFNFRNDDSSEDHRIYESCDYGDERCDLGEYFYRSPHELQNAGRSWHEFAPVFQTYSQLNCYGDAATADDDKRCSLPRSTYAGWTVGADISFPAVTLAFRGYVVDVIMFFARLAYDYSRAATDLRTVDLYEEKASRLGRYALLHISNLSHTMVHELGHAWVGELGSHCDVHCCMDIAANRFTCKLRGELGLPRFTDAEYSEEEDGRGVEDDWDPDAQDLYYQRDDRAYCSSDTGFLVWSCDLGEGNNGVEDVNADYCSSTSCLWDVSFFEHMTTDDPDDHCRDPYE